MITPYNPTDGQGNPGASFDGFTFTPEQVAAGDVARQVDLAAAMPPPPPAPLSGETVDMLGPDGSRYAVPKENASKAKAQGFRLETPEERDIYDFNKAHPWASPLTAWYKGVVSGSTLGVVDDKQIGWLVENVAPLMGSGVTTEQVQKYIKKSTEDHPFLAGAGDVAAMLLTLPVAAGAAGAGVRGGTAVARFVAGEAGAKAAGSWAGRTALEGLGIALPKAFREAVEGDPGKAVESAAWGAGGNLLFMGGLKGVGKALGAIPGSEELSNKLMGRAVGGTTARDVLIREFGGENAEQALEKMGEFARKELPFSETVLTGKHAKQTGVLDSLEKWRQSLFSPMPATESEWAKFRQMAKENEWDVEKAVRLRKEAGVSTSQVYEKFDEASELVHNAKVNGVTGSDVIDSAGNKIGFSQNVNAGGIDIKRLERRLQPWLQEMQESFAMQSEAKGVRGALDHMLQQQMNAIEEMSGDGFLSFSKFKKWASDYAKKTDHQADNPLATARKRMYMNMELEAEQQGRELLEQAAKIAPERFDPALVDELQKFQSHYRKLRIWEEGLKESVHVESKNRHLQISDNSWGIAGAIWMALTGTPAALMAGMAGAYAHRLGRLKGNLMLSKLVSGMPTIEASMRSFGSKFMTLPEAISGTAAGAVPAYKVVPAEVFSQWAGGDDPKKPDLADPMRFVEKPADKTVASYVKLANDITKLANDPAAMQARIQDITSELMKESPVVAAGVARHYGNMIAHLNSVMPKANLQGTPYAPAKPSFSKTEMQTFAERLMVADDPHWVQQFLATRTLKKEHLETLFSVWPSSYRNFVERIQDHAMSGQAKPVGYNAQLQLSLLTGTAVNPHMTPKALQGYQQLYVQESMGGAPGMQGVMKAANMNKLKGPGKDSMMTSVRLEQR